MELFCVRHQTNTVESLRHLVNKMDSNFEEHLRQDLIILKLV